MGSSSFGGIQRKRSTTLIRLAADFLKKEGIAARLPAREGIYVYVRAD